MTPASMDTRMLEALLTQCTHHTRTYATQQHAQTTSTGSMDSQSLRMGETRERMDTTPAESDPNKPYKTYSDGSVYLLPRGQTCAGYATTNLTTHTCTTLIPNTKEERVEVHIDTTGTTSLRIIPAEHVEVYITPKQVTREYLPSHQPWTSTDTPLQFNPSAMSSYRPEGKGLDKALDNLLMYTDPPKTIRHYLDNEAILKSAAMPERNKNGATATRFERE